MKKITIVYKKAKAWLFRDGLELNKHWWHRLIKVIFLVLFFLITIGSYIMLISYPNDTELLSKHNIHINNTLYKYTENYNGEDYENTIPKFFEQKGSFGVLLNNKIEYISLHSLGKSFCLKAPEKYQDNIIKIFYEDYKNQLGYKKIAMNIEDFSNITQDKIFKDSTRKCFINDSNIYDKDFKEIKNLSANIINYRANALYYIEVAIIIPLMALVSFVLFALVYYHLILYIAYGNRKK
ncbi:MAG TPA: hypothetical protein PLO44_02075 [Candidatus Paceibacterota bacterium]|nr:hypothetical protein [Candidatus Paceibacterota bacterium]